MTMYSNLGVVLELLREEPAVEAGDGLLVRGESSVTAEQREAVVDHVQSDATAQLTLFLLATELKADATDSDAAFEAELRAFVEAVRDRFDVNLLRTAAANRDRLPDQVPETLLTADAVATLDG
jgi:hypothetical protein